LKTNTPKKNSFVWSKFIGLASQWAILLFVLGYFGKQIDQLQFLTIKKPIFIWLFPFLFILFSLIKVIKDTNTPS
jgi:hypothetical protein